MQQKTNLVFILLITLIVYSCSHSQSSIGDEKNKFGDINELYKSFVVTKNYKYLDSISSQIYIDTINDSNSASIIGTLMYLKEYSELDSILNSFDTNDSVLMSKKEMTHNIVKHLNRGNRYDNQHIESNIIPLTERIRNNKKDSLAYMDLFINLIYVQGKEKTLNDIDTLQKYNANFSTFFYDYYLRESVKEYPVEFYNALPKANESNNDMPVAVPSSN